MGVLGELCGNLLVLLIVELQRLNLLLQCLEYHKQGRNYEQLAQRTDKHTANGCRTKSLVSVLSYTVSEHHRQQTDNHGQRSHKDRTQTGTGSQNCRPRNGHTSVAALKGELHDKNGVLGQKSDKHDKRYLHVDVVLMAEQLREEECSGKSERNRQQH